MFRLPGRRARTRARRLPLAAGLVLAVGAPLAVRAETHTVTDCGDSLPGTTPGQLRHLVNLAAPGDTIVIPACTLSLAGGGFEDANATGDLDISKTLTIQGAGPSTIIVSSFQDRVLDVHVNGDVQIHDLELRNGFAQDYGGAIRNLGQLRLERVRLWNNSGWSGGAIRNEVGATLDVIDSTLAGNFSPSGQGGGLYNAGTATLLRTVVSGNLSNGAGGINNFGTLTLVESRITGNNGLGVVGGGMMNAGTATLERSLVDGNQATLDGGGLHNSGNLAVLGSTISGNRSHTGVGGGLTNTAGGSAFLSRATFRSNVAASPLHGGSLSKDFGTSTTLEGTIFSDGGCMGAGTVSSLGYNLDEGASCGLAGPGDLTNVGNARLGALLDNGGSTPTHALLYDSPAINAGGAICPAVDQRGVSRPQEGACDIGAFEWVDLIFEHDFESGDFTPWTVSAADGGDLFVTPDAALGGTLLGMAAVVDDLSPLFVEDHTPSGEVSYRARFYFDPNGFDPGEAQNHFRARLLLLFDDAGTRRLSALVLRRRDDAYALMQRCRQDDGSQADTGFFPITDEPHWVMIEWRSAATPDSGDGSCRLTVDGTVLATVNTVQNSSRLVGKARLGALSVKAGSSGTLLFDEFVSRRAGAIPPLE